VFGETGGLRWSQEQPNQLFYMPLGERMQVIERGEANLSPEADRTTRRVMDAAANLYPRAEDGLRSMAAVYAVAESGKADGKWLDARPLSLR